MNATITFEQLIHTNIDDFINGEIISKDAINKSASFSHIILTNSKLTFKVKSLEI